MYMVYQTKIYALLTSILRLVFAVAYTRSWAYLRSVVLHSGLIYLSFEYRKAVFHNLFYHIVGNCRGEDATFMHIGSYFERFCRFPIFGQMISLKVIIIIFSVGRHVVWPSYRWIKSSRKFIKYVAICCQYWDEVLTSLLV